MALAEAAKISQAIRASAQLTPQTMSNARKEFVRLWKNHYNLVSVSLFSFVMIALEKIMELEFKCPQEQYLKVLLVVSYVVCPSIMTFFISLTFHPKSPRWARCVCCCLCCTKCSMVFKSFLPPLIWCAILLCDGRYLDCVTLSENGTMQNRTEKPPRDLYTISQVAGLYLATVLVIVCCMFHICLRRCSRQTEEDQQQKQLEKLLVEETKKHIEEMKTEAAGKILAQAVMPLLNKPGVSAWKITEKKIEEAVESGLEKMWDRMSQVEEQERQSMLSFEMSPVPQRR